MSENEVSYSMETPHYSDVYGFFVDKTASCAGATRATGLCLNQLGIPYEHVNEGGIRASVVQDKCRWDLLDL